MRKRNRIRGLTSSGIPGFMPGEPVVASFSEEGVIFKSIAGKKTFSIPSSHVQGASFWHDSRTVRVKKSLVWRMVCGGFLLGQIGIALGILSAEKPEYREERHLKFDVDYFNDSDEPHMACLDVLPIVRRRAFVRELERCGIGVSGI